MAAPLYTSNAIYAPPSRKFRVDPISFLVGAAVGALGYHLFRPKPVTAVVEIAPKPVKPDPFYVDKGYGTTRPSKQAAGNL